MEQSTDISIKESFSNMSNDKLLDYAMNVGKLPADFSCRDLYLEFFRRDMDTANIPLFKTEQELLLKEITDGDVSDEVLKIVVDKVLLSSKKEYRKYIYAVIFQIAFIVLSIVFITNVCLYWLNGNDASQSRLGITIIIIFSAAVYFSCKRTLNFHKQMKTYQQIISKLTCNIAHS